MPTGAVVVPGFEDPHVHLLAMAAVRRSIDAGASAAPNLASLRRALTAGAAARPGAGWLRATGFDDALVTERCLPPRAVLDDAVPDRPLALHHAAGRVVVLNRAALVRLGFDASAHDGVVAAGDPRLTVPAMSPAELAEAMRGVSDDLVAAGVVAVTDASVSNDLAEVRLLDALVADGVLAPAVRILPGARALGSLDGLGPGARLPGGAYMGPAAKIVVEGDDPDDLVELVAEAHRAGWPVAVHVTDVDGLARSLDALGGAPRLPAGRRDRFEHLSLCLPEQVAQVAASGAVVVTQPAFLRHRRAKYAEQLTSVERSWLYRVQSLLDAGVPVSASSDAPVVPASPLEAMAAAVDRGGFAPAEAVDRATSLALVTRAAADASGTGGGVLRLGDPAAATVLSGDPRVVPADEVSVLATVVGSRILHRSW